MAEQGPVADQDRRPAPVQGAIGVAILLVAAWGLAGGPAIGDLDVVKWAAVGVAIIVGVGLIVVGGLARGKS